MSQLTEAQYAQLRAMARAYAPDLPDLTCSEVLLMLYAVCEVLELESKEMVELFGRRAFGYLRHWGDRRTWLDGLQHHRCRGSHAFSAEPRVGSWPG